MGRGVDILLLARRRRHWDIMTRVPPVEQFKEACRCPISREARINEKRKNECHSDKGSVTPILHNPPFRIIGVYEYPENLFCKVGFRHRLCKNQVYA